ncbi:MAG TPA: hypothetical protein RMG45_22365, partial [Polyangiaceae bacterium LLY-WYZ-15_(1-7)]|nr:hypothetical protein [Polyangiaceae bacterium LLY-WYZ-15_(1-7)]
RDAAAEAKRLAALHRGLLATYPTDAPRAAALVDLRARTVETFAGEAALEALLGRLEALDVMGGVHVRDQLAALGFDEGERRLAELHPTQKTVSVAPGRAPVKLSTGRLVRDSCLLPNPFGKKGALAAAAEQGPDALGRRLQAAAKALAAFYAYGRLHGAARVLQADWAIAVPVGWWDAGSPRLYELKKRAAEGSGELEVVLGMAPPFETPWAGAERVRVRTTPTGRYGGERSLVGRRGPIDDMDVQRARLVD